MRLLLAVFITLASGTGISASAVTSQDDIAVHVLAYERQGTPYGGHFIEFAPPELTAREEPVFMARFTDDPYGGTDTMGLWIVRDGVLQAVVMEGQIAPGFGGGAGWTKFVAFGTMPRAGATGSLLFSATLRFNPYDPDTNETIWAWGDDQTMLAQEGSLAPSLGDLEYGGDFETRVLSPWGDSVFGGLLRGDGVDSTNDRALFYSDGSGVDLLVRKGAEFSSDHPGVYFLGTTSMSIDQAGRVAFMAALSGPNVQPENDSSLLVGIPGDLMIAVRRGDQAVGVAQGLNFGRIRDTSVVADGTLCFSAELNEEGMTSWAGEGIWIGRPNSLSLVVRDGKELAGGLIAYRCLFPVQNQRGDVCFRAGVDQRDREPSAIVVRWADLPFLWTIAYAGQHAPGTEPETVFWDQVEPLGPYLSEIGNIAFVWALEGPDVDDSNRTGLWALDAWGELVLVLRAGTDIELGPGDMRTVKRIIPRQGSFSGTNLNQVLGARGVICFLAEFTDGSFALMAADLAPCLADYNDDMVVNTLDVLSFLNAFMAGDMRADFDGDGRLTTLDVLWFLQAFNRPC